MLRREDAWIWDSWTADDGEVHHLFFLHAPRALGDLDRRHTAARIGHATSPDLVTWTDHGDALVPEPGGWDDLALWTGSVVRGEDDRWRMFYTALGRRGLGVKDQRVGIACSADLFAWSRDGRRAPAVALDPRRYRTVPGAGGASETWRDPFVEQAADGSWAMLLTARAVDGLPGDDGVLATATAPHVDGPWTVGAPASRPGAGFGQLEVPQVRRIDGRRVLVFTCHPEEQTAERVARHGPWTTWYVTGDADTPLHGPWDIASARPFTGDPTLFGAPLVQTRAGGWAFVGFHHLGDGPAAAAGFEIADPLPVVLDGEDLVAREPSRAR